MTQRLTTPVCTADGCDNPTDGYLCTNHAARLRAALHTVINLWPDTLHALARTHATSAHTGRRGSDTPLPYDQRAAEARFVVAHTIHAWTRVVADTRGLALPPDDVPAACAWLLHHVTWARHQTWAADLHDEIAHSTWRLLIPAVDRHPDRTYLGPCAACGRDLYTHPTTTTTDCPCGTTTDVATQRQRLLTAAAEQVRPAAWVARYLALCGVHLQDARIRQWKRRGRLESREVDQDGRPLYRVGDVLALLTG